MRFFVHLLLFIFITCQVHLFASGISYGVEFRGLKDPAALNAIKSTSQLTSLKKHPPASMNALRYRAESDIPDILKILHSYGYYEATVDVRVEENLGKIFAIVSIHAGPVYTIEQYKIDLHSVNNDILTLKKMGIVLGCPALSQRILSSELKALEILAECGYPLAEIEKREVIADGKKKSISIDLTIKTGPLTYFGNSSIQGLREVKERYVFQQLNWVEGDVYDSRLVESTQKTLIDSALFSSVVITHLPSIDEDSQVGMKIDVIETKHKNINIGVSYQTVFGPGITFGLENRNVSGMGRKLSFQGDVTKISQTGTATYLLPDFRHKDQDLTWQAIAMRENIFAYNDRSYSITGRLDSKIRRQLRFSAGARCERLYVTDSADNGDFTLIEIPLYVRWSSANSLLNPTRGATLEYRAAPSLNMSKISEYYLYQEISQALYYPLNKSEFLVFAQNITFGTILSNGLEAVPIPKRFLGGSEEELRGYRYRTVSPLKGGQPEGGRSAIYYTFETRFRVSQTIGLVPFFDIGNVYTTPLPKLTGKWFKSTGLGLRYFSFIGPLRLDVAFPLNRRKGIDPFYRFLVSIGQTF